MQRSKNAEFLLTTEAAANVLGCSTAWLERQRWKRQPPRYIKVRGRSGRMVRYRMSDLMDYISENCVDPGSLGAGRWK